MVNVLDTLTDHLWNFVGWLQDLYEDASDLWLIGDLAGSITYGMYYSMFYVAVNFDYFNTWCDDIIDDISDLSTSITRISNTILAFLSWSEIKTLAETTWDILTEPIDAIIFEAKIAVLGVYTSLDAWFDTKLDIIEAWIVIRFEKILDEVFK